MKQLAVVLVAIQLLTGCATLDRPRVLWGAGIGGTAGAVGGAALSPNDASRGWNALVFGGIGAIVGGLVGYLTEPRPKTAPDATSLKARELTPTAPAREIVAPAPEELPGFVKARLQPVIIEEYEEPDTIGTDGTLHEPHKVYRIKKQAELFARPIQGANQ